MLANGSHVGKQAVQKLMSVPNGTYKPLTATENGTSQSGSSGGSNESSFEDEKSSSSGGSLPEDEAKPSRYLQRPFGHQIPASSRSKSLPPPPYHIATAGGRNFRTNFSEEPPPAPPPRSPMAAKNSPPRKLSSQTRISAPRRERCHRPQTRCPDFKHQLRHRQLQRPILPLPFPTP